MRIRMRMEDDETVERVCGAVEAVVTAWETTGDPPTQDAVKELKDALEDPENLPREIWDTLASRGVSLGALSQGLAASVESSSGTPFAMLSSHAFLGLLMCPASPLYSIFSPIAFLSLLRSLKNSVRNSTPSPDAPPRARKGAPSRRRKKAPATPTPMDDDDHDNDNDELGTPNPKEKSQGCSVEEVIAVLSKLEKVLKVLQLRDNSEVLKSLIELLAQLPYLIPDDDPSSSGPRAKRLAPSSKRALQSSTGAASSVCFRILGVLLDLGHGDLTSVSIAILRALVPTILTTHQDANSCQHRDALRQAALQFVTGKMLGKGNFDVRKAVIALPRYLTIKAPDRSEARGLTVEAIVRILRAFNRCEQHDFGGFVVRISRGRPHMRLMAVDLALALLSSLPDPFGLENSVEEVVMEETSQDELDTLIGEEAVDNEVQEEKTQDESLENENDSHQDVQKEQEQVSEQSSSRPSEDKRCWGAKCLEAVLQRCSDKVPAVRSRALANVAQVLDILSTRTETRQCLQALLGFGNSAQWESASSSTSRSPVPVPVSLGDSHADLGILLRRRCMDDKAAVRKAALVLMTKSSALLGKPPDDIMLRAMGAACSDPMVSIKKAAMIAISEVLKNFPTDKIIHEWLQSVPSLVMDNESSIQEECLNLFEELVFSRISSISSRSISNRSTRVPESGSFGNPQQEMEALFSQGVLFMLKGLSEGNVGTCVSRICTIMGKKGRIKAALAHSLQNIISTSEKVSEKHSVGPDRWIAPPGVWFLLSEVSLFVPKAVGWKFLHHHWKLFDSSEQTNEDLPATPYHTPVKLGANKASQEADPISVGWGADRVFLLQTIASVAIELDTEAAADLAHDLLKRLNAFSMHPTEVGAHVKALVTLCRRQASTSEEGDQIVGAWVKELISKSEKLLDEYISQFSSDDPNRSFQSPEPTSKTRSRTKRRGSDGSSLSIQVITAVFTIGAVILVCPTTKLGRVVSLLQTMVTSKSENAQGRKHKRIALLSKQIAPTLYIQAWVALGKVCLAKEKLAKSCIPLFMKELEVSDNPAIRNNIMVVMTDFCVRYTALVDGFIPKLTRLLKDTCEIVRRQTFILLARLLQRDYVKWRGLLFHRFLLSLVDESEKIRQLADFLFDSILKTKAPLLAYNSFVEAIFILNDCQAHTGHIEALQASQNERLLFSLRGNGDAATGKRMHIYVTLLKQMQPEHILATTAKLCAEILAVAADGLFNLQDSNVQCVLQDALRVLSCKEMRLQGIRGGAVAAENADLEEEGGAAAFAAAAKGRVVTHVAKKNLVQNSIPIFVELKRLLESKNSPLTGNLMECLRTILKDFKNELDEILVGDKQLQKEILYDIQKHEANKSKSKVAEAVVAMQETPCSQANAKSNNDSSLQAVNVQRTPRSQANIRTNNDSSRSHISKTNFPRGMNRLAENSPRKHIVIQKDNIDQQIQSVVQMSALKRKEVFSPGGKITLGRVRWLDQESSLNDTPTNVQTHAQLPSVVSSMNTVSKAPSVSSRKEQSTSNRSSVGRSRSTILSPNNIPANRRQSVASAVADVAASQTINAVLKEVASGCPTPLKTMSIPKLKPSVPSTIKARHTSAEHPTGVASTSKSESNAGLKSIQKMQSFDDADA